MWRKKNAEVIVQISILIGIATLLLYGMISKKVNYYVHPRFNVGIWMSIIILFLFSINMMPNIKKARHNVNINHYIIFVIPILAALLFSKSGENNINITNSNILSIPNVYNNKVEKPLDKLEDSNTDAINNTNTSSTDILPKEPDSSTSSDDTNSTSDDSMSNSTVDNKDEEAEKSDISGRYARFEVDGITVISDDMLQEWYTDLYDNIDCFEGKRYQYLAQVFSMEAFKENQFLAGRYFMVCCAADLAVNGVMCESDKRSDLKEGQWITVTGTIVQNEYDGMTVPMFTNVTMTQAEAPATEYLYYKYN